METIKMNEKLEVNVNNTERILSVLTGAYMMYRGFRKPASLIGVLGGAFMMARGYSGFCPLFKYSGSKPLPNPDKNINIRASAYVQRSAMEVYQQWRNLSNLPAVFKHIEAVVPIDDTRSLWTAELFNGIGKVSWEAEIVNDIPGVVLAWKSVPGTNMRNAGKIEFIETEPGRTKVSVFITYASSAGIGADLALKALNPLVQNIVQKDVDEFKMRLETMFPEQEASFK